MATPYPASIVKKEEQNMYAVIATGGKQYRVSEGDVIRVEKLGIEKGEKVTFDNVLAVGGESFKAGKDVQDATVEADVISNGRAKKVIVYKYKPKTGYHKKNGHRQYYTAVKITKINA
jgi:large subunit ribosomal protein L21